MTDAARDNARYSKSYKGSAVNPVLREGNSDQWAPNAVKAFCTSASTSLGKWTKDSKTALNAEGGDFSGEKSVTVEAADDVRIELELLVELWTVLKPHWSAGEVIDAAVMSRRLLRVFLRSRSRTLPPRAFSHLKATMMKVSDPLFLVTVVEVCTTKMCLPSTANLPDSV